MLLLGLAGTAVLALAVKWLRDGERVDAVCAGAIGAVFVCVALGVVG